MKKYSKEQIAVIAVSFIAIIVLAFQVVMLDPTTDDEDLKSKYRSSVDSVIAADSLLRNFSLVAASNKKDIFNLKIVSLKRQVQSQSDTTVVKAVKTKWIASSDVDLFTKDKISYSFYFNGKARFTVNGKTQEVKVGDVLTVGNSLSKEVIEGTNEPTGNTRVGKEYSNKILVINERAVYIDSDDKKRVIRFKPNADATFYSRDLMDTSPSEEKDAKSTPDETPGRRPRGGSR